MYHLHQELKQALKNLQDACNCILTLSAEVRAVAVHKLAAELYEEYSDNHSLRDSLLQSLQKWILSEFDALVLALPFSQRSDVVLSDKRFSAIGRLASVFRETSSGVLLLDKAQSNIDAFVRTQDLKSQVACYLGFSEIFIHDWVCQRLLTGYVLKKHFRNVAHALIDMVVNFEEPTNRVYGIACLSKSLSISDEDYLQERIREQAKKIVSCKPQEFIEWLLPAVFSISDKALVIQLLQEALLIHEEEEIFQALQNLSSRNPKTGGALADIFNNIVISKNLAQEVKTQCEALEMLHQQPLSEEVFKRPIALFFSIAKTMATIFQQREYLPSDLFENLTSLYKQAAVNCLYKTMGYLPRYLSTGLAIPEERWGMPPFRFFSTAGISSFLAIYKDYLNEASTYTGLSEPYQTRLNHTIIQAQHLGLLSEAPPSGERPRAARP